MLESEFKNLSLFGTRLSTINAVFSRNSFGNWSLSCLVGVECRDGSFVVIEGSIITETGSSENMLKHSKVKQKQNTKMTQPSGMFLKFM